MNGISVMACVQAGQPGFSGVYGRDDRMHQKYVTISRQQRERRPAVCSGQNSSISTAQNTSKRTSKAVSKSAAVSVTKQTSKAAGQFAKGKGIRGRSMRRRSSSYAVRALVLAVIFASMLAGFQMMTRASNREKEPTYKYYTTVTIGYGEDLSDIVYRYCDSSEYESADEYVREICDINGLPYHKGSVPDLHAGVKVVIPYFSTEYK